MNRITTLICVLVVTAVCGCKDPSSKTAKKEKKPTATEKGIFGKKDTIGEFDPNADNQISDGKAKKSHPLNPLGSLNQYGPALEKISTMHIQQAVNLFYAAEGRYPRDFAEFNERIVKPNNIQLPKLPGGAKYQYDVENHKLIVVKKPADDE